MFSLSLTAYGQSQVSTNVQIDGIALTSPYIPDISSLEDLSSLPVVFEDDSTGNSTGTYLNLRIRDLSSSSYQAKTILLYKLVNNVKKIVAAYSNVNNIVNKTSSSEINLFLSLDASCFTNGFSITSIQASPASASLNTDGIVHIEDESTSADDSYSVYSKPQVDSLLENKQDSLSAGDGIAITNDVVRTTGIPFGICDNTSTATAFTVTVPGIYKLEDGVCCLVKNGVITSAAGFTLDVNGLGGKPVYSNMAAATAESTIFNVSYTLLFVYDSTRVSGGCWICYRGYYSDKNDSPLGYNLRTNNTVLTVTDRSRYYKIFFTSDDNTQWVPASSNWSNDTTTSRTPNQRKINPFGRIVYTSASTSYTVGTNLAATTIWDQYPVNLGYSYGPIVSLTPKLPVFVKCAPQSDGSAIVDSTTPLVQTLPTTNDGKIYIFLGVAYGSETTTKTIDLFKDHPVYYHDGTSIKVWIGKDSYSKIETETLLASYVPTSRTVNNKALYSNITLNLDDVADGSTRKLSNYVPTSRTVNSKALSSNITLTLDDVADGTTRSLPTVNNASLTINKGGTDDTGTKTFTANASSNVTINLGLSTVASSGSYNDLSNKPTIPTVNNTTITIKKNTDDTGDSFTTNASTAKTINLGLSTVATSGSYNDLSNKPTIPTVNNATLTIKKNTDDTGTTFTANASSNVTCNLGLAGGAFKTVDESISNNSTSTNIPTSKAVSDFVDAKGFITSHQSLADLVATAQFNSSTNKIEFYNKSNTKLSTDIDATPFLKDGMIDSISIVTVTDPNPYGNTPTITLDSYTSKMSAVIIMRDIFGLSSSAALTFVKGTLPSVAYTGDDAQSYYLAILAHEKVNDVSFTLYGAEHKYLRFHYNSDANKQDVDIALSSLTQELESRLSAVAFSGSYNSLLNKPTIPTIHDENLLFNATVTAGSGGIFGYQLCFRVGDNLYESICTSYSSGTSKVKNTNGFYLDNILYYNSNVNISSGSYTVNSLYKSCNVYYPYSFNCGLNSLTIRSAIYLVVTYNYTDKKFYLADTWWTQTLPNTEDGKYYVYLGVVNNNNSTEATYNTFHLDVDHPIFYYKNGRLLQTSVEIIDSLYDLYVTTNTAQTITATKTFSTGNYLYFGGNASIAYFDDYSSSNALQIASDGLIYIAGDSGSVGLVVGDSECWTPAINFGNWDNNYNANSASIFQQNASKDILNSDHYYEFSGNNLYLFIKNDAQSLDDDQRVYSYNDIVYNTNISDFQTATFTDVGVIKIRSMFTDNNVSKIYQCTSLHPLYVSTPTLVVGVPTTEVLPNGTYYSTDPRITLSVYTESGVDYLNLKAINEDPNSSNNHNGNLRCNNILCSNIGTSSSPVTSVLANNIYAQNFGIPFGVCSTAEGTQIKEVKLTYASGCYVDTLVEGMIILVKFTESNTAAMPALRIRKSDDSVVSGYRFIVRIGATYAGTDEASSWMAGETVMMRYDGGSNWIIINHNTTAITADVGSSLTNMIPASSNSYNLGSSSYRWNYLYVRYIGSASYPATSIYGRVNSLYNNGPGAMFFFKLNITNKSSTTDYTIPRGTSLSSTAYFTIDEHATSLLYINSYEERVDDTSGASFGTDTFTGTYCVMMQFKVSANATVNVYVPCLKYSN